VGRASHRWLPVPVSGMRVPRVGSRASGAVEFDGIGHIWPARAPLGYVNVVRADGKHVIEPDPEIGPVIKRVFELYASGNYSLVTITKQARKEGLSFRKSKQPLPRTSIHTILKNLTYTGDFMWHGVRYRGIHTPLITLDTYELVQEILEGRAMSSRHDNAREFLFSGLIRCGVCAAEEDPHLLVGEIHKKKYVYYRCEACKKKDRAVYVREPDLDLRVMAQLRRLRIPDEVRGWIREGLRTGHDAISRAKQAEVDRINAQIARLQQRIDTAYDDRLDGRIDAELFEHRSRAWREEQVRLRRELDRYDHADQAFIEAAPLLLELANRGFELYESMDTPNRRRLLNFLCSNCVWTPDALTVIWREPFDVFAEWTPQTETGPDEESSPGPVFVRVQGLRDSNPGPVDLESTALPTELNP
jgi:site-specific DNA recombinase